MTLMSQDDVRPFAFMRLTHEAIRVGLEELPKAFADAAANGVTPDAAVAEFLRLLRLIELHTTQEDAGLYPLVDKHFDGAADKEGYVAEHETLHSGHAELEAMVGGDLSGARLEAASAAVATWAQEMEEHLQHEERVLQPLLSKLTADLPAACQSVHGIIDVANRDETERWQVGDIAQSLERGRPFGKLHKFVLALQHSSTELEYERMKATLRRSLSDPTWEKLSEAGALTAGRLRS